MNFCANHNGYTGDTDQCPTCNPGRPSHEVTRTIADLYESDGSRRIAGHLRACADAYEQFGSVSVVEGEASGGPGRSEALKTTPSNSAPSLDHAITVPPSVEEQEARKALVEWLSSAVSPFIYDRSQFYDEFWSRLNRLIAAVRSAQPPSQAWQPIETVFEQMPSNRHWLGWCPEARCTFALVWHYEHKPTPNQRVFKMVGGGYLSDTPTHWMPIPSPPSQAIQETEQEHDSGGDDAHGGRGDLEPAARPELPHDGDSK